MRRVSTVFLALTALIILFNVFSRLAAAGVAIGAKDIAVIAAMLIFLALSGWRLAAKKKKRVEKPNTGRNLTVERKPFKKWFEYEEIDDYPSGFGGPGSDVVIAQVEKEIAEYRRSRRQDASK